MAIQRTFRPRYSQSCRYEVTVPRQITAASSLPYINQSYPLPLPFPPILPPRASTRFLTSITFITLYPRHCLAQTCLQQNPLLVRRGSQSPPSALQKTIIVVSTKQVFTYVVSLNTDAGKRRNRTTQSCLNCHTSKRMVSTMLTSLCSFHSYISFSATGNALADAALNWA